MVCLDCGSRDMRYVDSEKAYHCNNCGGRNLGDRFKFHYGDKVYHQNLKLYGMFLDYAWESDEECDVEFTMEDGEVEQRHVSINQLSLVDKI